MAIAAAVIDPLRVSQYSGQLAFIRLVIGQKNIMSDELLLSLETKLDRLILLTGRLQQENAELKARESDWQRERVRLVEKNELARSRVEAMITHLKNLDAE